MHAYATFINSDWCKGETYLAPYTTEVVHCRSCQADQMHYGWFAIYVRRLFWLEIGAHVSLSQTMFPSTLIDSSSGPVPRFWILVFCQEAFIPNVLMLPGNLRVLLITDHRVSRPVTAPIFSTLDYTRFTTWIVFWGRTQNCKENCVEEDWQQMLYKLLVWSIYLCVTTHCCYWSIVSVSLSFTLYFQISFGCCFFWCWKYAFQIRLVLLFPCLIQLW